MIRKLSLLVFACALSCAALGQEPGESDASFPDEEQRSHTIDEVPPVVMATARRAGPDVFYTSAESYWRNDVREYHLRGRLFREIWDVFIREDGKLLRTETDNQTR